jgi:hypothetical protein
MPTPPQIQIIEPGSTQSDNVMWRHTMTKPPEGWMRPSFNDSRWKSSAGGFGTEGTPGAIVRTKWDTADIWLRREIAVPADADMKSLQLYIHHDEDAEVYLNGVLAAKLGGYISEYETVEILPAAIAALKPGGKNLLAVHCHQTGGGQYIDVGLAKVKE